MTEIFFPCILALARLTISIWLTFCIESQSTHISEKKYYESQSTLSIGISQFSLLSLMEKFWKSYSWWLVSQNTAK